MSVNRVTLVGRCGTDSELRRTSDGVPVANVRIATQEPGDKQAEWHNVAFFGGKAELVAKYGTKGKLLYIEGKLRTNSYINSAGVECKISEVVVNDFRFLDKTSAP